MSHAEESCVPTFPARAQLHLCCMQWWAEANMVVTVSPLPPPTLQAGSHLDTEPRGASLVRLTP